MQTIPSNEYFFRRDRYFFQNSQEYFIGNIVFKLQCPLNDQSMRKHRQYEFTDIIRNNKISPSEDCKHLSGLHQCLGSSGAYTE